MQPLPGWGWTYAVDGDSAFCKPCFNGRMNATFEDPYMAPAVLQDVDCTQVESFSRDDSDSGIPEGITHTEPTSPIESAWNKGSAHEKEHFILDKHCKTCFAIEGMTKRECLRACVRPPPTHTPLTHTHHSSPLLLPSFQIIL